MMYHVMNRALLATTIGVLLLLVSIILHVRDEQVILPAQNLLTKSRSLERSISLSNNSAILADLRQRMKPTDLICSANTCPERQFFHLHHMKSGGTSVDTWINCARIRWKEARNQTVIPSSSLSECSGSYFQQCVNDSNHACRSRIESSAIMSYCAPLFVPNMFGWEKARAITMLRHPVDRVWSMYRFTTRGCYGCKSLKQVYELIDSGQIESMTGVCAPQIENHMTRNLMTNNDPTLDSKARLEDALYNLKHRFTVVMVLERLQESIDLVHYSLPWMARTIQGSNQVCEFPHANSSPENNRCGPNNTHLPLPSKPDDETRALIMQHNQLDIQLYDAALQHFELQLQAVGDVDESSE